MKRWNKFIPIITFCLILTLSAQEMAQVYETEEITLSIYKETNIYYFSLLPSSVNRTILTFYSEEFRRKWSPENFDLTWKIENLLKENKINDADFWGSFNGTVYDNVLFSEGFGEGNMASALKYLSRKKNPNAPYTEYGIALLPLNLALYAKRSEVACMLLEAGADPNQTDDASRYPICQAAQNNDAITVRLLLQKGAHKNLETALPWAARNNSTEMVELLLEAGADPNRVDSGMSSFEEAATNQNAPIARMLIAKGAVINTKSYWLRYALRAALDRKNELVSILQNAGVEVP